MKRKTSLERLAPKENKVLKVVIEAQEEDVKPPVTQAPMSARAARLAAIASGEYKEELSEASSSGTESDPSLSERESLSEGWEEPNERERKGAQKERPVEGEEKTDIVFMGQVSIGCVFGAIELGGAVLSSDRTLPMATPEEAVPVDFYPVFCPRSHALLRMRPADLEARGVRPSKVTGEIDESLLEAVYEEMDISRLETLVVIKEMQEGMAEVHRVTGHYKHLFSWLPKERDSQPAGGIQLLPGFCPLLAPVEGLRAFCTPQGWSEVSGQAMAWAKRRETVPVSLICGAKNQGKSSFGRYWVNRLLSEYKTVAYLETDPGQTEFTPPGLVSLHYVQEPLLGPSYTHPQLEPARSFFLGSTSARSHPDYYTACVRELVAYWRRQDKRVPLVVNTQGWISGVGYELLLHHIHATEPTDIFMMRHSRSNYKNLPESFGEEATAAVPSMVSHGAPNLHTVESYSAWGVRGEYDGSRIRDLTMASYFHQVGMGSKVGPEWDYSQHLVERVPWVVDWRTQLNAVWIIYEEVKTEEVLYALNGSVVGILGPVSGPKPGKEEKKEGFTPPTYFNTTHRFPPQPEMTTCHGLAIVRAIDPSSHTLLLLTPLPAETLEKASAIVKGELQLPPWALLDSVSGDSNGVANIGWDHVPYVQNNQTEGVGSKVLKIRRNLLRRN